MFVWDERKREANLEKHGLDFRDAQYVYSNPTKYTKNVLRHHKLRHLDIAVGEFAGKLLTLVYTKRGADIRVISFRRASEGERDEYEQNRLGES